MKKIRDYKLEILAIQEAGLLSIPDEARLSLGIPANGYTFLESIEEGGASVRDRLKKASLTTMHLCLPMGWSAKLSGYRANSVGFWAVLVEIVADTISDDRIKDLPVDCKTAINYAINTGRLPKNYVKAKVKADTQSVASSLPQQPTEQIYSAFLVQYKDESGHLVKTRYDNRRSFGGATFAEPMTLKESVEYHAIALPDGYTFCFTGEPITPQQFTEPAYSGKFLFVSGIDELAAFQPPPPTPIAPPLPEEPEDEKPDEDSETEVEVKPVSLTPLESTFLRDQREHELIVGTVVRLVSDVDNARYGTVTAKMKGKRRVKWFPDNKIEWVRVQDLIFVDTGTFKPGEDEPTESNTRKVDFRVGDRVANDGNYNLGIKFIPGTITRFMSTGKVKVIWDDRTRSFIEPEHLILLSEADYPLPNALYPPTQRITSVPGDITPEMVADLPWEKINAEILKREYQQTNYFKGYGVYILPGKSHKGYTYVAIACPSGEAWQLQTEDLSEYGNKYNDILWHLAIASAKIRDFLARSGREMGGKFSPGDRVIWGERYGTLTKEVLLNKPGTWWEAKIEPTNYSTLICETDLKVEPYVDNCQYILPGFEPQEPEPPDPDDFASPEKFKRAWDEYVKKFPDTIVGALEPTEPTEQTEDDNDTLDEAPQQDLSQNEVEEDGVEDYSLFQPPPEEYGGPVDNEEMWQRHCDHVEAHPELYAGNPFESDEDDDENTPPWIMKTKNTPEDDFDRDIDPGIVAQVFDAIVWANYKRSALSAVDKVTGLDFGDIRRASYEVAVNRNFHQYSQYSGMLDNAELNESLPEDDIQLLRHLFSPLYVPASLAELDRIHRQDETLPSHPFPETEQQQTFLPLSFGWVSDRLHQKDVTRRTWSDNYAKRFIKAWVQGRYIMGYDKAPFANGQPIALISLRAIYKEKLANMPESELAREGFPELTKQEFVDCFFNGDDSKEVWVVRFKIIKWLVPKPKHDEGIVRRSPALMPKELALAG